MVAERHPVLSGVMHDQRRSLVWWGLALGAVCTLYISIYPVMGEEMASMVQTLPEGMVNAFGYDRFGHGGGLHHLHRLWPARSGAPAGLPSPQAPG